MSEYVIAEVRTKLVDRDFEIEEPYYKIFLYEDGGVWYETEFETLENARKYVEVAEQHPDMTTHERIKIVEKGE